MEENPCQGLLEVGKEYSYKELCEAVYDKQTGGNGKKAQLKRWARCFSWEHPINKRTGNPSKKFLITEVFESMLPEEDSRGCLYDLSDILLMLIDGCHFARPVEDDGDDILVMGITKTKMNQLVGLCNAKYVETMRKPIEGIPATTQKDFFSATNSSFNSIVKTNLERLQKYDIIKYNDGQLWYEEVELDGKLTNVYHVATDEEEVRIRECRYLAIKDWNNTHSTAISNYGEVFFKLTDVERYEFDCLLLSHAHKYECLKTFKGSVSCHRITFSRKVLKIELEKRNLLGQNELVKLLGQKINEQMYNKVVTDSQKRYNKALEASKLLTAERPKGWGKVAKSLDGAKQKRLSDGEYVEHCREIADLVIPTVIESLKE